MGCHAALDERKEIPGVEVIKMVTEEPKEENRKEKPDV